MLTGRSKRTIAIVAVVVLSLITAVAVPLLVRARRSAMRSQCINNLRMISDAKDRILEYGRAAITCDWSFVGLTVKDMSKLYCPLATGKDRVYSNSYDLRRFGEDPTCRIAPTNANGDFNHSLSFVPGT